MKLTKNLLSLCIGASVLLASHATLAQTFRAADVHRLITRTLLQ